MGISNISAHTPITQEIKRGHEKTESRLHIYINGAREIIKAKYDIIDAFKSSGFGGSRPGLFGSTIQFPSDDSIPYTWNLEADYTLTDVLRLGLVMNRFAKQKIDGIDYESECANGYCYGIVVTYIIPQTSDQSSTSFSRLQYSIGAGLLYNKLTVDGSLNYKHSFEKTKNVIGGQIKFCLDKYIKSYVSVQLKLEIRLTPSIKVPTVNIIDSNNKVVKTLKAHSVNFSSICASVGFGFHI